jgi:hypothetical protein
MLSSYRLNKKGDMPGWGYVVALIIMLAFIIVGLIIMYSSGKGMTDILGGI